MHIHAEWLVLHDKATCTAISGQIHCIQIILRDIQKNFNPNLSSTAYDWL